MEEHKDSNNKSWRILKRLKQHQLYYVVASIAAAVIALAAFTGAVDNLIKFYREHIDTETSPDRIELSVFAGSISPTLVELSFANRSTDRNIEIASISLVPVSTVDSCPSCSYLARIPLSISLGPKDGALPTTKKSLSDPYRPEAAVIFGADGAYHLKPGESAPFSLSVVDNPDFGLVFKLRVAINDLRKGDRTDLTPGYFFYYVGPPRFSPRLLAFKADHWLHISDESARTYIAKFWRGDLADLTALPSLAEAALNDESNLVRQAAINTLGTYDVKQARKALKSVVVASDGADPVSAKIRLLAATALVRSGDLSFAPILLSSWSDARLYYRDVYDAVEAYAKAAPVGAAKRLAEIVASCEAGNCDERERKLEVVLRALGYTRQPAAIPTLKRYARDGKFRAYRAVAMEGLSEFSRSPQIIAFIKDEAIRRKEPWSIEALVRMEATQALEELQETHDNTLLNLIREAQEAQQ